MQDFDNDTNRQSALTLLKDALSEIVMEKGKDDKPVATLQINSLAAWYKTQNINSWQFGMLAEYLEDFASHAETVQYSMSAPMAEVLSKQIKMQANVIRRAIDAKSSETMRNKRNAQTSLLDKLTENKQERVIDVKGELKRSIGDMMMGKESAKATD